MIDIQGTEIGLSSKRLAAAELTNLEVAKMKRLILRQHFTQKFVGDREHPLLNFPQSRFNPPLSGDKHPRTSARLSILRAEWWKFPDTAQ